MKLLGPVAATLDAWTAAPAWRNEAASAAGRPRPPRLNATVPIDRLVDGLWGDDPPVDGAEDGPALRLAAAAPSTVVIRRRGDSPRSGRSSVREVEAAVDGRSSARTHPTRASVEGLPCRDNRSHRRSSPSEPICAAIRRLDGARRLLIVGVMDVQRPSAHASGAGVPVPRRPRQVCAMRSSSEPACRRSRGHARVAAAADALVDRSVGVFDPRGDGLLSLHDAPEGGLAVALDGVAQVPRGRDAEQEDLARHRN